MDIKKEKREWKRSGRRRAALFWGHTVCLACVMACTGNPVLSVKAAPVTLKSPSAIVYEAADEGSDPIGNLVQDNSFEYIGDITAEDGSIWHQVTIAGGVSGFIKGDAEMETETGGEESVGEEQQEPETPAEGANDAVPAETEMAPTAAAPEEDTEEEVEEEETPEAGAGEDADILEEDTVAPSVMDIQNNHPRTYARDISGRIKDRNDAMEVVEEAAESKKKALEIDVTLLLGAATILFCMVVTYIFQRKIKRMDSGMAGGELSDDTENRHHKKNEKRKRSRRKKNRKKRPKGKKGNTRSQKGSGKPEDTGNGDG